MCGIYGAIDRDPADVLPAMGDALVHRGPDGSGVAVRGRGALGCRRLVIIDVAGGAQPFTNESGDVIAVCNREIYLLWREAYAADRSAGLAESR